MPYTIVIFGASGDLTRRKLIPALYQLFRKNRLPKDCKIVGVSRSKFDNDAWRNHLLESLSDLQKQDPDKNDWSQFATRLRYFSGDIAVAEDFSNLSEFLAQLEASQPHERIFYLSTSPNLYSAAVTNLGKHGLANQAEGSRRIIVEKPFGTNLATAKSLNTSLHAVFPESQIYRIDHYLGKESVQNLLVLRFANSIFEPIWNRNYIDHVQITVAESLPVGSRSSYYNATGVLRDMFQNHLLQLLTITAMEAPARYAPNMIRDEKVKVLRAIRPMTPKTLAGSTLRGQYDGYRNESGVPNDSQTDTFAAVKLFIDNWRWTDVPFYLRSGKAMSCRTTQIVIQFRKPPHMLFSDEAKPQAEANRLVIQIQPAEGIQLHFQTKVPDAGMKLRLTDLDFSFQREFSGALPDAYQRLLLDAINGDASLFARSDEVELAWEIIDPIANFWRSPAATPVEIYPPQLWGPETATEWMRRQGREWFDVCPVLN